MDTVRKRILNYLNLGYADEGVLKDMEDTLGFPYLYVDLTWYDGDWFRSNGFRTVEHRGRSYAEIYSYDIFMKESNDIKHRAELLRDTVSDALYAYGVYNE